jgi:hypothetical protein
MTHLGDIIRTVGDCLYLVSGILALADIRRRRHH